MTKRVRIIISCILVVFAFGAGILAYAQNQSAKEWDVKADAGNGDYLVDKDGKIRIPPESDDENAKLNRGTEGNPLFILEIVPYDGMAEFGYLIDGQEPLDVDALARNNEWFPGKDQFYTVTNSSKTFAYWPEDKPDNFKGTTQKMKQYGIMTKVAEGEGQYTRTVTEEVEGNVIKATYTEATNGDFLWTPLSAEECLELVSSGASSTYETGYQNAEAVGDSFKMYFADVDYVTGTGYTVEHNDVFLRESVGLAYEMIDGTRYKIEDEDRINQLVDNYHVEVYTVTPEDLNLNPGLVDRADLIVFSTEANMGQEIRTYVAEGDTLTDGSENVKAEYKYIPYLREGKFGYEDPWGTYGRKTNIDGATFKTNLLDWDIALKIYDRATNPQRICPIVLDTTVYSATRPVSGDALSKEVKLTKMFSNGDTINNAKDWGTQNNITKLFLMMYQMTNPVFESFYGEVTYANHAMFTSEIMKDADGDPIPKKGSGYLTTGKFLYDSGWSGGKSASDANSRVYWNDLTLLPWYVVPKDNTQHNNPTYYGKYMGMYGIMVEDTDAYMNNITSGDAQNSIRNGLMQYDGDTKMSTGFDTDDCMVKNNEYGAELYTFFNSILPPEELPITKLTSADCLYYLLNGLNVNPVLNDKVYKILELEPTNSFESKENFWNPLIAAYTNSLKAPVVDQMTTSEFIGSHVECISDYDMIYVGMNKRTDDITMKFTSGTNFVYAHSGPKITVSTTFQALYGWLGSSNNNKEQTFLFSGNDLTTASLGKLKTYDSVNLPILFGDGFFTSADATTMASTIDRNSNIYLLGDEATHSVYEGALYTSMPERVKLRQSLALNKRVEMVFESESDYPIIYDSTKPDAQKYINGLDNANRTLRFKFKVTGPAGTSYNVRLLVDSNTDGVYNVSEENVGASVYEVKANGAEVLCTTVTVGKTYVVKRKVMDRIGSVCWKLDLVKNNKTYASFSGVSAIQAKSDGSEDKDIVVLQILPKTAKDSLVLPVDQAQADAIGGASKLFYEKIQGINGMNLQFVQMKETEILAAIKGSGDADNPEFPDYLYENYDMLVLGFADIYDGVSDPLVLDKVEEFITYGKAVLYTHDTSSPIGANDSATFRKWGANVTKRYRDLFGMDRYGALSYILDGTIPGGKDTPYSSQSANRNLTPHKNSAGQALIQGVSNGMLYRTYYPNHYSATDSDSNVNTKKVSKVNNGAITTYPYNIPETISVASTHAQYYQLDMEKDDIVVWYCLADDNSSQAYEKDYFGVTPNDVRNNYYIYNIGNVTYSGMGHIPSSTAKYGMEVLEKEVELFVNTFVAAYRATARPVAVEVVNDDATSNAEGSQFLCIDVDSSDPSEMMGTDIKDTYTLQVEDDTDGKGYKVGGSFTKKSKRVYFRLIDNNSYGGTEYSLKIVLNDGTELDGVKVDGENEMFAVFVKDTTDLVDSDVIKYDADDDDIYHVDVPINIEERDGNRAAGTTTLKITVTMKYKIGSKEFTVDGDTMVYIMPRGLFDLD